MPTIFDKQGRSINIHECPSGWKISPFQRDSIFQEFLKAFPATERAGILKECLNEDVRSRAMTLFERLAKQYPITADRIHHFVSEAVAIQAGYLSKSDHWDWWVGCSLLESNSESSVLLR